MVGLPESVQFTIDVVLALFDEVVSLEARIGYILEQYGDGLRRQVIKLAIDWDPHGVIGMAAMCLGENADLTGKPYLIFEEFAGAAIKTVGGNMMCALFVLNRSCRKNEYCAIIRIFPGRFTPRPGAPLTWWSAINCFKSSLGWSSGWPWGV